MGAAGQAIMAGNLLASLEDHGRVIGREFGRDDVEAFTFLMTEAVRSRGANDYARAIRTIHAVGRQIEGFLQRYDLILTPTMAVPPQKLGVLSLSNPDLETYIRTVTATVGYTQIFNASGHPAMSVPLHWSEAGLPIGVQLAARMGDEAGLLRVAAQLESARPWAQRRPEC
jgi:Asp-tRNA(Asn)/Glu-tRNA(Gln) amidotransferase A subunit family amidase